MGNSMKMCKKILSDETILYIFNTFDGYKIESVFSKSHHGLCVSTQIGCKIGCLFCASCKNGFIRNLNKDELQYQIDFVTQDQAFLNDLHFAGIGEPLLNYDSVISVFEENKPHIKDIYITTSAPSLAHLNNILKYDFTRVFISFHSFDGETRKKIMPHSLNPNEIINNLSEKIKCNDSFKEKIYIGYLLLHDINDSPNDIEHLTRISMELDIPVYLMFCNRISYNSKFFTDERRFDEVISLLDKKNIRFSKSSPARRDRIGGCGTLRVNRNEMLI